MTSRREPLPIGKYFFLIVLAAFVLATPADGERLVELLRLYRRATVRETLVRKPADNDANVIMLSQRHPGRR